jgi:hypothetical protein
MRRILIDKIERDLQNLHYGLPWKYDATCFNFRPAKELVHVLEIDSIKKKEVESLIIGCDLEDYSFISDMTNLKQLYIYSGQNITELDFVKNLVNLTQLFIADSKVESAEGVVELLKKKARIIDEDPNPGKRILRQIEAVCIETESEKVTEQELEAANPYFAEIIVKKPAK